MPDRGSDGGTERRSTRPSGARIDLSPSRRLLVLYRILADLVVVAHLSFIAFVAVGSLLVWKRPHLLWPHVAVVAWAAAIVTVGFTCPLTPLEQLLRERAGQSSYDGGFVDHYLDGVVYPGRFTALARLLVGVLIVIGYARLLARNRRRRQSGAST
jgi:Protein of Unknown function (DUF2784)